MVSPLRGHALTVEHVLPRLGREPTARQQLDIDLRTSSKILGYDDQHSPGADRRSREIDEREQGGNRLALKCARDHHGAQGPGLERFEVMPAITDPEVGAGVDPSED